MGSIAKKFVSRSLVLALFLSLGYLALPVSPAAQGSREAVILAQKVKEDTRVLQQRKREEARAQQQVKDRERLARGLATLLAKAEAQHAMIKQWHQAQSSKLKIKARGGVHK